jgi:hypothetical protein
MRLRAMALVSLARQLSQHSSYLKLTLAGLLRPFEDHGRADFFAEHSGGLETTACRPAFIRRLVRCRRSCGPRMSLLTVITRLV